MKMLDAAHPHAHPHVSGNQLFALGVIIVLGYFALVTVIILRSASLSAETAAAMAMGTLNIAMAAAISSVLAAANSST